MGTTSPGFHVIAYRVYAPFSHVYVHVFPGGRTSLARIRLARIRTRIYHTRNIILYARGSCS